MIRPMLSAQLEAALQEFADTFADDSVAESVAPHMTCLEAEPVAILLESMGRSAESWWLLHDCPVRETTEDLAREVDQ